ncbi:LamB/YcsF family protein [Amycolatopsis acidiphila]|uniref:LamB/YcsF family protein n=1 Tax=Amycolatopsis acidiphila TaxID=715473 RepID=A0A558A4J0_9PSEU|nr:5-oxoprolinase subunit PxpA [Amycolatopsis acidiphila]TVT19181.1 LamB/YcsF family protein [Amycolatopsis acidiphila]UIJ61995.1 LamB/YcsF family protein [Amycolatopsis acidiphila]GHG56711.1 LamB/YcsF family protein [Amycolatopsis acidiphila]
MKKLIDLNADAGESFGRWRLGDDEHLLPLVSSVNVACGWHAGDPATMRRSVELAREAGTALGAHPGLPDLAGFGRRSMALSPADAADACLYQYGALRGFADALGVPVAHVKPHGAFYGLTMRDPEVTDAIVQACRAVSPELIVVLLAGETAARAEAAGVRVAREAFADLEYDDNGHIIIEPQPLAKDPRACADRVLDILDGHVTSAGGKRVEVDADTICLHGDRPNAVEIAAAIRDRLAPAEVTVAPIAEVLAAR